MHTNVILVPEKCGIRKGTATENAALKQTDRVLKCINQKCMLVEFYELWQKLLPV
jgi:hypothetical protein